MTRPTRVRAQSNEKIKPSEQWDRKIAYASPRGRAAAERRLVVRAKQPFSTPTRGVAEADPDEGWPMVANARWPVGQLANSYETDVAILDGSITYLQDRIFR